MKKLCALMPLPLCASSFKKLSAFVPLLLCAFFSSFKLSAFVPLLLCAFSSPNAQITPNLIKTEVFTDPDSLPSTSISYADGLGRQMQTSLFLNDTLSRISGTVYDDVGRPCSTTVAFTNNSLDYFSGDIIGAAISNRSDNYAYSAIRYKPDPLGRSDSASAPGIDFSFLAGKNHFSRIWYLATELGAANAVIDANGFILQTNLTESNLNIYEAGTGITTDTPSYFLTVSKDPNGAFVQIIQDIFGRTISTLNMQGVMAQSRYDVLGNLLEEDPPGTTGRSTLSAMATLYQYDTKGQLMYKKTPDAGEVYYQYNDAGQLVATQNARQRNDPNNTSNTIYSIYLYDSLGRNYAMGVNSTTTAFTDVTNSISAAWTLASMDLRLRKIYDDPQQLADDHGLGSSYTPAYFTSHFRSIDNTQGRLVAELAYQSVPAITSSADTRFFDSLTADIYTYDENGNVAAKLKRVPGMKNFCMFTFNFGLQDNALSYRYSKNENGDDPVMDSLQYQYDHHGRMIKLRSGIAANPILSKGYNELGQLQTKNMGRNVDNSLIAEAIQYDYTLRNWPKSIMPTITNVFGVSDICYNDNNGSSNVTTITQPQYNGNISAIRYLYNPGASVAGIMQYQYDNVNRLTDVSADNTSYFANEQFAYNNNGAFSAKERLSGPAGVVTGSNYVYNYIPNTNKVHKIENSATKNQDNNYVYDPNGNMVFDFSKKMLVEFDWRDMPIDFKFYNPVLPSVIQAADSAARANLWKNIKSNLETSGAILKSEVKMTYDAGGNRVMKREYRY
jgi:YD repeat-containing protein